MIKALSKVLTIRVSPGMHEEFEYLAKAHQIPTARAIRAALWTFLQESEKHRLSRSFYWAERDEEFKATLMNLDWLELGQKGYDFTPEGRAQEEADYKAGMEDDGKPEE